MGLTIHYRLKLDENVRSFGEPLDLLRRLREEAMGLPFEEVGEIAHLKGSRETDFGRAPESLRWLLIQAGMSISPPEDDRVRIRVNPLEIIAFSAWPGEGCEEANMGLCRYPPRIRHSSGRNIPTGLSGWNWSSFCKTQYANSPKAGGPLHFLNCHLSVVALLDQARRLGLSVEVSDAGGYWEHRSPKALVETVAEWDQMIAAVGGALKDKVEGSGLEVIAPVFERGDFERLEAMGISDPKVAQMVALIRKTAA